jgi:arginine:pyruvate transaminase
LRYARRAANLGGPAAETWNIHNLAAERRRRGEDVILLTIGDPDFPSPAPIVEAAKASLDAGRTHYADITGQPPLRAAVAAHHERLTGRRVPPEDVVVLAGAQCALFAALQCLVDPGDEVVVFEPAYVTYPATIAAAGAVLVPVPLRPENGFHLDPADLRAALTPRTRAVLWNSPNNPTGAVASRPELEALAAVCRERDLWLISDEVYATLVYDGEHLSPSALPGMEGRTAVVSSVSKSHAMTGWRLGWLLGPPELARHAANLALCMLYGSPAFVQDAATLALTSSDLPELADMRGRYRRRRDAAVARLRELPLVACHEPAGGMFVMLDARGTGRSAHDFAFGLLEAEGVAVLPGDAFGAPAAGHVRISLTVREAELARACERIGRYVRGLGASAGPGGGLEAAPRIAAGTQP